MTLKTKSCFAVHLKPQQKLMMLWEKFQLFFQDEDLQWENVCVVCADGAPAMLAPKSGFQPRVKKLAAQSKGIHCMID